MREILRNWYYIFLVGYHIDNYGNVYEQILIIATDVYCDLTLRENGSVLRWSTVMPRVIGMNLDPPKTRWSQAIPNGIFAFDSDSPEVLIVSAHEIRESFLFWQYTDTYYAMTRTNVAADVSV